jgi:hypothetical protein
MGLAAAGERAPELAAMNLRERGGERGEEEKSTVEKVGMRPGR